MLKIKEWLRKKYSPEPVKADISEGEYVYQQFPNLRVETNERGEKVVVYRPTVSLENVEIKIS